MQLDPDNLTSLADALERRLEAQAEAAKQAIREYKKTILQETASGAVRRMETQREVEHAVSEYMRLRRRLDELRAQTNATRLSTRAG